jgi:hypothetical protein
LISLDQGVEDGQDVADTVGDQRIDSTFQAIAFGHVALDALISASDPSHALARWGIRQLSLAHAGRGGELGNDFGIDLVGFGELTA